MKLTTLFLILAIIHVSAKSYSQSARLNIKMQNATLSEVFDEIENQTEFHVFYKKDYLDDTKKVNVNFTEARVERILDQVLAGENVTYRVIDKDIVITRGKSKNPVAVQQRKINGTVTTTKGEPVVGVTVLIKGTSNGTITNVDGYYELNQPNKNAVLVFSFIGMISKEVVVGNQTKINVTLEEDTYGIEEVVAIGYGTVKKANVTNAVAKINSDVLEERPLTTLSEAFSGQIAGVYAQQTSGLPGKDFEIKIRGTNTITSGTGPLFVVDGMPVDDMTDFNMNDVESVEVLKDASAAAIYGARGAGGIVLITTKTGKPGDTKVDFEAYTGVQMVTEKIDIMNAAEWQEYSEWAQKEKYRRDGKGDPFADPSITFDVMGKKYWRNSFWYDGRGDIMTDTDWQKDGLKPAVKNNYQLTLTKGLKDGSFLASANYLDQDGLFKGTGFKRYNFRSNASYNINEKLEVGLNISASYSLADGFRNGEGKESPYMRLIVADPTVPSDGNYRAHEYGMLTKDPNPIIQSERIKDDTKTTRTMGSAFVNYEIIDGLTARGQFGLDIRSEEWTWFKPLDLNKKQRREGRQSNYNSLKSLVQGTLNYSKSFDNHTISALAGASYEEFHRKTVSLDSWDFASDDIHTFNTAATFRSWNDTESEWALQSFFGRLGYNYGDRYIASASVRRDGSSRFGQDTKYGIFPSASLAWRISEESFFEPISIISNMKLRLSWGKAGNDNIGNYSAFGRLGNVNYAYGGKLAYGFAPVSPDNPTLTWETNTTKDIGLDLGFLENRIAVAFDYYINVTEDLLLDVPAPAITGFPGSVTLNSGSVENRGWEVEVTSTNVRSEALGGIRWKTSLNLSHNENEVTSLGYGIQEIIGEMRSVPTHITKVGLPIRSFYLYDNIGVLSEADMADSNVAKFNKQEAGNEKLRDVNGDGIINDGDRTVVGSNHPDLIFGLLNQVQIGDFDLSVLLTGVTGFDTYFFFGRYIDTGGTTGRNQMPNQLHHYNGPREFDGTTPYPFGANPEFSDIWLYKGDYYRIKNLTLGYSLPKSLLSKTNIRSLRAYVSIDNLLNFTEYPGGNPETNVYSAGSSYTQGADYGTYPLTSTYIFGVKIGF